MASEVRHGDCLEVARGLAAESVDLVYVDPPFFTQKTHSLVTRDRTTTFQFSDEWKSRAEYIEFLHVRVKEFRRVLKTTGSLFFQCDTNASHHIRCLLDEVFGEAMFRSEIIWHYRRWSNSQRNPMPSHQTIFFYTKTDAYQYHQLFGDYSPSTNVDQILQRRQRDEHGKAVYARDGGDNGSAVMTCRSSCFRVRDRSGRGRCRVAGGKRFRDPDSHGVAGPAFGVLEPDRHVIVAACGELGGALGLEVDRERIREIRAAHMMDLEGSPRIDLPVLVGHMELPDFRAGEVDQRGVGKARVLVLDGGARNLHLHVLAVWRPQGVRHNLDRLDVEREREQPAVFERIDPGAEPPGGRPGTRRVRAREARQKGDHQERPCSTRPGARMRRIEVRDWGPSRASARRGGFCRFSPFL